MSHRATLRSADRDGEPGETSAARGLLAQTGKTSRTTIIRASRFALGDPLMSVPRQIDQPPTPGAGSAIRSSLPIDPRAAIIGLVQGITEFLPMSSSGHTVLARKILGWRTPGLAFEVALHAGTLVALAFAYRRDFLGMARAVATGDRESRDGRLARLIIIATAESVIGGAAAARAIRPAYESPRVVGWSLMATGFSLLMTSRMRRPRQRRVEDLTAIDAVVIGIAQSLSLLPGLSRTALTLAVGRLRGLSDEESTRFSFLLAAPVTLGAMAYEGSRLLNSRTPLAMGSLGRGGNAWTLMSGTASAGLAGTTALFLLKKGTEGGGPRLPSAALASLGLYCLTVGAGAIMGSLISSIRRKQPPDGQSAVSEHRRSRLR